MAELKSVNLKDKEIRYHYDRAADLGIEEVERLARNILTEYNDLDYFLIAMGTYFFVDKTGETIDTKDEYRTPDYSYRFRDSAPHFAELNKFIGKWDHYLKLTGAGMKFMSDGTTITNW